MDSDILKPPPEQIKADVDYLKEWIQKEPHLPKIDDDRWLETFLFNNKFSLEKTKSKLEKYYSLRTKYPEILKNRDGTSPEILQSCKHVKFALSHKLTKDNSRIFFIKYEKDDAKAFDVLFYMKRLFMYLDLLILSEENRCTHLVNIVDFQNLQYSHALKVLTGFPKIAEIFNGAYTERIKEIHMVNLPGFGGTFIEAIKSFFPPKISNRICIHSGRTLFEMVDEDLVCSDLGGKGPSMDELQDMTMKDIQKHQKWFDEQDNVCSNEALRRKNDDSVEKLKGSFRKLEVD